MLFILFLLFPNQIRCVLPSLLSRQISVLHSNLEWEGEEVVMASDQVTVQVDIEVGGDTEDPSSVGWSLLFCFPLCLVQCL